MHERITDFREELRLPHGVGSGKTEASLQVWRRASLLEATATQGLPRRDQVKSCAVQQMGAFEDSQGVGPDDRWLLICRCSSNNSKPFTAAVQSSLISPVRWAHVHAIHAESKRVFSIHICCCLPGDTKQLKI